MDHHEGRGEGLRLRQSQPADFFPGNVRGEGLRLRQSQPADFFPGDVLGHLVFRPGTLQVASRDSHMD